MSSLIDGKISFSSILFSFQATGTFILLSFTFLHFWLLAHIQHAIAAHQNRRSKNNGKLYILRS